MPESTPLQQRSEILFLYEVKDANPNGDPLDENKPRTDPDTGQALVSDVRIKRTVRDYWHQDLGKEILVRDTWTGDDTLQEGKQRAADFETDGAKKASSIREYERLMADAILDECVDARCFGLTLPVTHEKKDGSITLTGPVQISGFSRSLHPVAVQFIQGTAAFAGGEGKTRKSFREEYKVPYALIGSYGVVNNVAAKSTGMTDADRDLLLQGLWRGTEGLITRSKVGHLPLLLVHLISPNGRRIGNLTDYLQLRHEGDGRALRSVRDYQVDVGDLLQTVRNLGSEATVEVYADPRLQTVSRKAASAPTQERTDTNATDAQENGVTGKAAPAIEYHPVDLTDKDVWKGVKFGKLEF